MKTYLRLFTACLIFAFSGAVDAMPLIGIIRDNHGQGWHLYTLGEKLGKGQKLFILSSEDGRKVTCCATVTSAPLPSTTQETPFISDAEGAGSTEEQIVYDVSVPDNTFSGINGLALAVRAKSVTVEGKAFAVAGFDGKSYRADLCMGSEGINVYLYSESLHEPLKHYYGNLGYDLAGGDCDRLN